MITTGQARMLRSNINAYISWAFIAAFSLACGLILWHAAFGTNPVERVLLSTALADTGNY